MTGSKVIRGNKPKESDEKSRHIELIVVELAQFFPRGKIGDSAQRKV